MIILKRYIFIILQLVIFIFSLITNWYSLLIIAFIIILVVMTFDKMGKGIVLREFTAILYTLTCLLMPLVGYTYYTRNNHLARLWVKFMPVPEDVYFQFAIPAIVGFCLALTIPLGWREFADEGDTLKRSINRIKGVIYTKKRLSVYIILIGIIVGRIGSYLPVGLQFFASLFFFGSFAGLLYVYYTADFKYKKLLIGAFLFIIVFNALATGMFTIIAYMGITIFSFFLLESRPSFLKNAIIMTLAVVFILVLQNTKVQFRKYTWRADYTGSKIGLFGKLFAENIGRGEVLIEKKNFFSMYVRTNQGYNVACVMRRIPDHQPYDNGNNLFKAFASAFVPRFLWPDKPEAGGRFNMKYYAGLNIRTWSTNIGPLGEAYGSFGVTGGIIYMAILGAFIRWAYKMVFTIAKNYPLIICWIPVLFFQITYSAEADTLQILNSLIKSAFFMWILFKVTPSWFGKNLDTEDNKNQGKPVPAFSV